MNMLSHRNYMARVEFDADDHIFMGRIAGINDVVGFHGESVADLEQAFHEAVDDYVEACAQVGKQPEKVFWWQVMFWVDPGVHARAALAAQLRGISLNRWAEVAIRVRAKMDLAE